MRKFSYFPIAMALFGGVALGAFARGAVSQNMASDSGASQRQSSTSAPAITDAAAQGDMDQSITQLQTELDIAREQRESLQNQVSDLLARLTKLESSDAAGAVTPEVVSPARTARRGSGGLTIENLQAAGMNESEALAMKRRIDDLSMQRLYLRDQASRDGSLGKEDYRREMRRISEAQNNLETEFGADNYERYLYAMGRPNRVSVDSVIDQSPAYNAGLQAGDRIVSYDGTRIFSPNTIRRQSARGQSGEMVPVIVDRNGSQVDMYIPRGPLGVQMNAASARPPSP